MPQKLPHCIYLIMSTDSQQSFIQSVLTLSTMAIIQVVAQHESSATEILGSHMHATQSVYVCWRTKKIQHIITSLCLLLFSQLIYQIQVFHVTLSSEDHEIMIIMKVCKQHPQRTWDRSIFHTSDTNVQ